MTDIFVLWPSKRISEGETMKRRTTGFTLVEILVVLTIVATLAGIVLAVVSSSRERSRQATCISQLHQIGLAFSMYVEDNTYRPPELYTLAEKGYLNTPSLLVCPSDPWGNLAGLHYDEMMVKVFPSCNSYTYPTSYFYAAGFSCLSDEPVTPHSFFNWYWEELGKQMQSAAGIAICKVHGEAVGNKYGFGHSLPVGWSFEGKILRLQRDGAVVVRKVYPQVTYYPGTNQVSEIMWDGWPWYSDKPFGL